MKPRASLSRSRGGMALVITLALVVLLAFVLVALFTRATSSLAIEKNNSSGVEALLLARSAAGLVVSDLQAEMKAFSTNDGKAYFPLSSTNMLPARQLLSGVSVADTNFFNLVKQSGVPMFSGSPTISISGGTSTDTASSDGRLISAARWSTPMLTGTNLPNTPNWIYINRDTTLSATASTNAIGRFAYNVYDIGGLLDMNVAGFSKTGGGSDPEEMPTKGGLVWADLRSIPGINAAAYANNSAWPPQWRITGDWVGFSTTGATGSLLWYNSIGWLQPYLNPGGTASDRMFSSRQDLIRYARANPGTFTANADGSVTALQYLGVFSRDVNQPSFKPSATRPKIKFSDSQGGNDAIGLDDVINPGARGTGGVALVKKRFALDNISLLSDPSADASRIKMLFGFTKNGNTWVYDHGSPSQILNLKDVPSTRDPDFFEILKAAIHAGSLGVQHGTSLPAVPANFYRPSLGYDDASLDYQIIQIGANIIDQSDSDSYPTQIVFDGTTFAGVENLPYMDAITLQVLPEKVLAGVKPPNTPAGYSYAYVGDWTGPFQAVALLRPRLWNPHSGNSTAVAKTPVNFRLRAETSAGGAAHYVRTRYVSATFGAKAGNWPLNGGSWVTDYTALDPAGKNYGPGLPDNPASSLDAGPLTVDFSLPSGWQSTFPNAFTDPRIISHKYTGSGLDTISGTAGATQFSTISPWIQNGFADGQSYAAVLASPYSVYGFPLGRLWMGPYVKATTPTGPANLRLFGILEAYGGPVKVTLECSDGTNWIPYDTAYYLPQDAANATDQIYALDGSNLDKSVNDLDAQSGFTCFKFDPRSKRWGSVISYSGFLARGTNAQLFSRWQSYTMRERETLRQGSVATSPPFGYRYQPASAKEFDPNASSVWSAPANSDPGTADIASVAVNTSASTATYSYLDPDGIRRRGMGAYWTGASFNGQPLANYNDPSTAVARSDVLRNRPLILNRPFRSVAELGYVFRDTPWRNLDFFTAESGDAALLDFFCIHPTEDASGKALVPVTDEGAPIVAGKVNLNTRQPAVLAALIRGAARENQSTNAIPFTDTDALAIANGVTAFTASTDPKKGPFVSLADLVGTPVSATAYAGFADELSTLLTAPEDKAVKQRRETVLRALVDAGSTRTWNVLIDVIAQSGVVTPGTTKFMPRGERRIWASTAIDRLTGKIIDRQWEIVNE